MEFSPSWLFVVAVVLSLASTLSLLFKNEGVRGMGRVVGGIAWALVGVTVVAAPPSEVPFALALGSSLIVSGLTTAALGYRKFKRRHLAQ